MKSNPAQRESLVDRKRRAASIMRHLKQSYPEATTALRHNNPLQLLVATILSAQCTDERVNMVTPSLFQKYRTAGDFARADPQVLEQEIRSTGFFRAKTRSIINCCRTLVEKHAGEVPKTMDELVQLPGVGRKTANVVLGMAFGEAEGIVVDTHVKRLSVRLGLSHHSDPERIETDLMEILPQRDWIDVGNVLIWHGRKVCNARKPKCLECVVNELCPSRDSFLTARR